MDGVKIMVMYAVEYEVSLDREDDNPFAKFTAFDSESFNVTLVAGICSGQDLRDLGDLLDIAHKELDKGTSIGSTRCNHKCNGHIEDAEYE